MPQYPSNVGRGARGGWRPPALAVALAAALAPAACPAADYASLSQVEAAAETRDYSQQVRDKKFAAGQEAYLQEILLPQLTKDANRAGIARTRQRIRELALRDAANEVVDPINGLLLDAMVRQAAAAEAEPLIRVNAMLLVGELVGADGKPWPAAAEPLADATADASLPLEVRTAALAGLARHVSAAAGGGPETVAVVGPAISGLVMAPPEDDPVARRWLLARALELLPAVAPPPAVLAAAVKLLADDAADPDLRVRAAAALGKLARPDAGIDAAAALTQIRGLAVAALEADLAVAEQRRLARRLSGAESLEAGMGRPGAGGPPAPVPPPVFGGGIFGGPLGGEFGGEGPEAETDEDAVSSLACRRDAWRLFTLAEAIRPGRSGPGLAELLSGDKAAAAEDLASAFRQAALDLDAQPDEPTLKRSLAAIKEAGLPAAGQPGGQAAPPPAGEGRPPASPFDQPAESSPF